MSNAPAITVTQAAAKLGYSRERIHQICHSRNIGKLITPQLRILTARDVTTIGGILSTMKTGRPKKIIQNHA